MIKSILAPFQTESRLVEPTRGATSVRFRPKRTLAQPRKTRAVLTRVELELRPCAS